uniref:E3 ubiquitin-protein ligase RNF138 n=1 Tax=Hucho hucho TaxID=62062 RepID=A0A4W5KF84_9TELE
MIERVSAYTFTEDYDCPICQDVLKTPIRTRDCRHVFCKNCFRLAVRAQGPHCPLCRGPVSETEKRATDVQQQMRERKGQCRACGTTTFLSKMRVHYKSCRKYLEEYGTPLDAPPPPVTPTTQEVRCAVYSVCPICAATVWGNASYCSRNLIGHLAIRHCFSYDTYMVSVSLFFSEDMLRSSIEKKKWITISKKSFLEILQRKIIMSCS